MKFFIGKYYIYYADGSKMPILREEDLDQIAQDVEECFDEPKRLKQRVHVLLKRIEVLEKGLKDKKEGT